MSVSKILVVDDEPGVLNALRRQLRKEPFEITATSSPEEALQLLSKERYAAVVSDERMPTMKGTHLLEKAREVSPDTVRIILTGYVDIQAAIEAINRGAVYRFITKPWNDEELRFAIRQAIAQFELVSENRRLQVLTEKQNIELKALNGDLAAAREQEVGIAAKIQQTLLQGQPFGDFEGVKLAAVTQPSQQVDGDFYDFFRHNGHCFDIVVGDVMGKGVPAALLGAATKSQFLRALSRLISSLDHGEMPEPEAVVQSVHAEVTQQLIDLESFATACYARFDLKRRRVDFVDCGHTKTVHFRHRTGECETLKGENMPLGFSMQETYEQVSVPFEAGDVFFFYSDGVTEARNGGGECFGEGRLAELICTNGRSDPEALIRNACASVAAFSSSETFADDLTCVAVRIGDGAPVVHKELEVTSDLAELDRIRAFVREVCSDVASPALDGESIDQFELAVQEAASNIMLHAYRGCTDRQVWVDADVFDDRVSVRLHHLGESFNPDGVVPPRLDGSQEHGFGLYIITQCTDEVKYFQNGGGKKGICLVKMREGGGHNGHGG